MSCYNSLGLLQVITKCQNAIVPPTAANPFPCHTLGSSMQC